MKSRSLLQLEGSFGPLMGHHFHRPHQAGATCFAYQGMIGERPETLLVAPGDPAHMVKDLTLFQQFQGLLS